jgi:hypothetical protein
MIEELEAERKGEKDIRKWSPDLDLTERMPAC